MIGNSGEVDETTRHEMILTKKDSATKGHNGCHSKKRCKFFTARSNTDVMVLRFLKQVLDSA